MVSRTMNHFDLQHKYPAACLYAVGLDDRSTGTLLLSLFTINGTKNSNRPWVNFQSAGESGFYQHQHSWVPKATRRTSLLQQKR